MGNIGGIFRSAYCLGMGGVILDFAKELAYEGIVRSSLGLMYDLPFSVMPNTLDLINELKTSGFLCLGASMQGSSQIENLSLKNALFFGGASMRGCLKNPC